MINKFIIKTCGRLIATCMFFWGCNTERVAEIKFVETKTINYSGLNVKAGWFSKLRVQIFRGRESLISFDPSELTLYFHDIDSLKEYHKINISPQYLKILGQTFYFYVDDSIVLLLGYPNSKIVKLNLEGDFLAKYNLTYDRYFANNNHLSVLCGLGLTKFGDNFLLYEEKYGQSNASDKLKYSCTAHFKLSSTDTTINVVDYSSHFPESYGIEDIVLFERPYITINNKQQLIYAFPPDKNLYVYNTDLVQKSFECPSSIYETTNDSFDMSKYGKDWEYHDEYRRNASSYAGIFFDKYRKLYYRVYAHKRDTTTGETDWKLQFYDRHFSIIVMDENFKKLGEKKFDRNKYYFYTIIPTPQGFMLPKIEADRDIPVNKAEFDLFSIEID